MDDKGLVERMRKGDEGAFAALFERHRRPVYRYAVHMGGSGAAQADDIVQEVFLAFLRQLPQYDARRGSVQSYLLGIARRQVFRHVEQSHDDTEIDRIEGGNALPALDGDPFDGLSRVETVERVRAAIGELPAVFREAVVLCELNELDYASAAAVMNCPIGTVRSRLHRARAALGALFVQQGLASREEAAAVTEAMSQRRRRSHG